MERPIQSAPVPDELLAQAQAEPVAPLCFCLSEYAPAFCVLVNKGMTWTDIHRWATERGIDRSKQSIVKATREYALKNNIDLKGYEGA